MNYNSTIKKLQLGINHSGAYTVMYNQNQFYSPEQRRPVTMYTLKLVNYNKEKEKNEYVEVFKTAQQLHVVLFLRNLLFVIQGKEVVPEVENVPNYKKFNTAWESFREEFL